MNNGLEWWFRDHRLVESSLLGNILDDGEVKLVVWHVGVSLLDFVCLLLRSDCSDDAVAVLKERVEHMGCDEAGASWTRRLIVSTLFRT